jgi:hypothetical protein
MANTYSKHIHTCEGRVAYIRSELKRRDDVIKLSKHRTAAYKSLYEYSLQAGYDQFVAEFGKDVYTKMMKEVY